MPIVKSGKPEDFLPGKKGDVLVADQTWFNEKGGYTFYILNNPYGDNSIVFKAIGVDPSLKKGEFRIFTPGGSAEEQAWALRNDKSIQVVSSLDSTEHITDPTPIDRVPTVVAIAAREYQNGAQPTIYNQNAGVDASTYWDVSFVTWVYDQAGVLSSNGLTATSDVTELRQALNTNPNWIITGPALPGDIVIFNNTDLPGDYAAIVEHVTATGQMTVIGPNKQGTALKRANYFRSQIGANTLARMDGANSVQPGNPGNSSSTTPTDGYPDNAGTLYDLKYGPPGYGPPAEFEVALSTSVSIPIRLPTTGIESVYFTGARALQNDVPLLEWVQDICTSSGRVFQSLPNGDFIAFYPNYFNWANDDPLYSQPYLELSDLELINLEIDLTDSTLATHVYTVGDVLLNNDPNNLFNQIMSAWGSIEEFPLISDFIKLPPDFDTDAFLNRYGARPLVKTMPQIKNPIVLAIYAWMNFFFQWSKQFDVRLEMTFMPELYPGALIVLKNHGILLFVEEVVHNFDRTSGFTTTATLSAPASIDPNGHAYGMVLAENPTPQSTAGAMGNGQPQQIPSGHGGRLTL